MKYWLVLACSACAGHSAAPAAPRAPQTACAVPLPLLAKQHTPNATRLYLAPLTLADGAVRIGAPEPATSKQGFVSQPVFAPDGNGLYFTWRPEGSQADIWFRDLRTGAERPITCTSVEEYSARLVDDGLTVIRVEPDLRRDMVRLGLDGRERQVLFPSMTVVGAYTWLDATRAALFVMPTAPDGATSLVLADVRTGKLETVLQNVGAAISAIPGTQDLSYVDQADDGHWNLMRLDVATRASTLLAALPDGVDRVAWLPDGSFLACVGARIVRGTVGSPAWTDVADLTGAIEGKLLGVAINKDHSRVALITSLPPA